MSAVETYLPHFDLNHQHVHFYANNAILAWMQDMSIMQTSTCEHHRLIISQRCTEGGTTTTKVSDVNQRMFILNANDIWQQSNSEPYFLNLSSVRAPNNHGVCEQMRPHIIIDQNSK